MIEQGDIYLADLGDEQRRRCIVVSVADFHRRSDRVLVIPEIAVHVDLPWRVEVDGVSYAVDRLRAMNAARLLSPVGRAPYAAVERVRRAIRYLT